MSSPSPSINAACSKAASTWSSTWAALRVSSPTSVTQALTMPALQLHTSEVSPGVQAICVRRVRRTLASM
ncbi:hypothetical protein [Melittangium boletus]|uniref:hypothetical protein n=1 Tax=Melittangium boletus TaxID=83453 RepID=UPI003DA53CA1